MSFESITLQTQEKYDLAKTMQASPCELESWDSATKLCYVLFANIPFIGEYVPSEEQFNDITAAGKELFRKRQTSLRIKGRHLKETVAH